MEGSALLRSCRDGSRLNAAHLQVREFLMGLPQHGILADVGCGNGKYFSVRPDMAVLGSDRSFGLARQAMKLSQPVQPSGTSLSAGPVHTKSSGTACERLGRESLEATDAVSKGKQRPETRLLGLSTTQFCPLADVVVADALHLPYQVFGPDTCFWKFSYFLNLQLQTRGIWLRGDGLRPKTVASKVALEL